MRTIRPLAALAALAAALALTVGADAASSSSGAKLLSRALIDGLARGSVHELSVATEGAKRSVFDDDVARGEGRQSIAIYGQVPGKVIRAHVRVTAGSAYVSGNQTALLDYFRFPAAVVRTIGTRWISLRRSDSGYASVASDATLSSALASTGIPGNPVITAPATEDGQQVVGLHVLVRKGSASVSATLYVTRGPRPLPVVELLTAKQGTKVASARLTFSSWGEPVHVTAPAGAVPVSSLGH